MTFRNVLSIIVVSAGILFVDAARAAPPVKVEVIIDGDDDDDDFFEDEAEPKPKAKPKATTTVRTNAKAAFDDLEREEARHSKNQNTNTQVVNVVVVGNEQQGLKTTAQVDAPPVAPAPPPVPSAPNAPAPLAAQTSEDWSCFGWFGKESHAKQADLLLFGSAGGYAAGAFLGLGAEAYATDTIGIRLTGHIGSFSNNDLGGDPGGNLNLFSGGHWANQRTVSRKNLEHGVAHLVDLSMTVHLVEESSFDPYLALGVSHYGYDIQFNDGIERGGAAYGRLGVGFNWHMGAFFAGLDAGWYPVELVRYRIEATDGGRGRRDDYEAVTEDIEDRFDPERFTATAHIGWRF